MMTNEQLKVRFETDGTVFHEATSASMPERLEIGRGAGCGCRVPRSDRFVSPRHALLEKAEEGVFISDLGSMNGIYLNGQPVSGRRKVAAGEVYSIGGTLMYVEVDDSAEREEGEKEHRLEQLSGGDRGRMWRLTAERTVVGSAADADIRIPDLLVSRHHAAFELKPDGSCWIRDLKSRNGTKVNGTTLAADAIETGCMLKDGDVVSVAFVDYRFLDRRVIHVRSHFLATVLVVVITLALALGAWFLCRAFMPSAHSIRFLAERLASEGEFELAEEKLAEALDASGADDDGESRRETILKVRSWRATSQVWSGIKAALAGDDPYYEEIDGRFATLITADYDNWKWNASDAPEELRAAKATHALLSSMLTSETAFTAAEPTVAHISALCAESHAALEAAKELNLPYLEKPQQRLGSLVEEMDSSLAECAALEKAMSSFTSFDRASDVLADLKAIVATNAVRTAARREAGESVSPLVANMGADFLAPIEAFVKSHAILKANYSAAANGRYGAYCEELPLPAEQCQVFALLPARRDELVAENRAVGEIVRQLANFRGQMLAAGLHPGRPTPEIENLFDESRLEKVFACDSFEAPPPGYGDRKASGVYDETLGVYAFFSYLQSLDGEFDAAVLDERFLPLVFAVPRKLETLSTYLDFAYGRIRSRYNATLERIRASAPRQSEIAAWGRYAEKLEARLSAFVRALYKRSLAEAGSRTGVIAGAMALRLVPEGSQLLPEDFRETVYAQFRELRRRTGAVAVEEDPHTPDEIASRDRRAFELAIPGDTYIRQIWVDRFKSKGDKAR